MKTFFFLIALFIANRSLGIVAFFYIISILFNESVLAAVTSAPSVAILHPTGRSFHPVLPFVVQKNIEISQSEIWGVRRMWQTRKLQEDGCDSAMRSMGLSVFLPQ